MPSPCRWLETPWLFSGERRDAMVGVWSLKSGEEMLPPKKRLPSSSQSPPIEMWPKRPVNSRSSLISMGVCPIRRTSRGNCGPPRRSTWATNRGRQLDDEEGTWHVAGAGTGADWQGSDQSSGGPGQFRATLPHDDTVSPPFAKEPPTTTTPCCPPLAQSPRRQCSIDAAAATTFSYRRPPAPTRDSSLVLYCIPEISVGFLFPFPSSPGFPSRVCLSPTMSGCSRRAPVSCLPPPRLVPLFDVAPSLPPPLHFLPPCGLHAGQMGTPHVEGLQPKGGERDGGGGEGLPED